GDWQEQVFDKISTSINESGRYSTISLRYIDAGLRESRLRRDDLFIPAKRRVFLDVLETAKVPAQILIFPKLTTGPTELGPRKAQRNYLLTLELVDIATGKDFRVSEEVRKAYR
ncbi:MAG: penicillin-binding protein activator LpoB, partial [Planctomycetes bacterium]|nr:penicillin-binding protein activator LpoB [Planctomycetota bacterium]